MSKRSDRTMNVVVRSYSSQDEEEVNRLFNRVFGRHRSLDQMRWEFSHGPVSLPERSIVADDRGHIVGFFGSLFQRIQINDQVWLTAYGADNAVDPLYRGGFRGLQYRMWEKQLDTWRAESVPFALGFPTPGNFAVGKRLFKWAQLAELEVLYKRLNFRLAVQHRFPQLPQVFIEMARLLSGFWFRAKLVPRSRPAVRITEEIEFPPEIDAFWEQFRKQYPVMLVRDRSYLNWRYAPQWGRGYRIWLAWSGNAVTGMAVGRVWKQEGSGRHLGFIMELATLPPHEACHALLNRMLLWFLKEGVDGALARLSPYDPAVLRLKGLGFRSRPQMWDRCLAYRLLSPEFGDMSLVLDPRAWHTTFGDSDGV